MAEAINRDAAGKVAHKLTESRNALQKGNIFSCLIKFREALEKMQSTNMIPADVKALQKEINDFQKTISENKKFFEIYGPITFRDNEIAPTLALMNQLIEIKNDEMTELLEESDDKTNQQQEIAPPAIEDPDAKRNIIKTLLENENHAAALELLKDSEDLADILADEYNSAGIAHRKAARFDDALRDFNNARIVSPSDEGIYYNMARVYIDRGEWETAEKMTVEAIKINHNFPEGFKLLKHIRANKAPA